MPKHRGIFINDEDWGLAPWATRQEQHADTVPGPWRYIIGPEVTERICQLLLRLRADTYWPAMHADTRPFFFTAGNREVVKKYGIFIGTSHCEPLAANTNGEWSVRGQGEYNFATNSEGVKAFQGKAEARRSGWATDYLHPWHPRSARRPHARSYNSGRAEDLAPRVFSKPSR